MEEMPTNKSAASHSTCPKPEPGWAGDDMPSPAGIVLLARVGYEVHPVAAAPPCSAPKNRLHRMRINPGHMNQYDIMFSLGKAMSLAPTMRGMVKFPNEPPSI